VQKFCAECSGRRDDARKAAWRQANGNPSWTPAKQKARQSAMVEHGIAASDANRAGPSWIWEQSECDDLGHELRVTMPFDYVASKNAIWSMGRGGHVYVRKQANQFRDALASRIRTASAAGAEIGGFAPTQWFQGKLWIDIFVEKPDHRGDAVNFVDLVCDAVKDATGVDDRWYCLRRVDWSIVKTDPKIRIGIGQAIEEDHGVCSHCGSILPLSTGFGRNRSTKSGFGRVCFGCSRFKHAK
jgi:hypothetical protein